MALFSYGDFLAFTRQKKHKTYILKPESGCQGKGIWVTKNPKEIKGQEHQLCQQYISKVRLFYNYAFIIVPMKSLLFSRYFLVLFVFTILQFFFYCLYVIQKVLCNFVLSTRSFDFNNVYEQLVISKLIYNLYYLIYADAVVFFSWPFFIIY